MPQPRLLVTAVRIKPTENSEELVLKHNEILCSSLKRIIDHAEKRNHDKAKKSFGELYAWCKNRPYSTLLKMQCLMHLQCDAFSHCLGYSQLTYLLDKKEANGSGLNEINISNMSTYVDKDFIKADGVKMKWSFLVSQFLLNYSKQNRIPMIILPNEDKHPVLKYYNTDSEGRIIVKPALRDRTHFVESHNNWFIRVADIVCTIFHRQQNRGQCKSFEAEFMKPMTDKNYKHLILNQV